MDTTIQELKISVAKIEHSLATANAHLERIEEKVCDIERQYSDTRVDVGKLEVKTGLLSSVLGALAGFFSSKL